ncbi:hypothetical protein V2S66_29890 [Streptomyces sp. V4-01]|uniref:Uncharacterized protein n=1 Tax=Actinacidiphila polyblastidii TaxID=3110430 RepID=A0ABU7PK09_9ACTN|nr:hypothetical protein [Streptomyces sp. V4-01]
MRASPGVRVSRAALFAVLCVLLAAFGHGLAMGSMPPLRADVLGWLAVLAPCCVLCGRERSLPGIGAAMLTAQAGLHVGFDAACFRPAAWSMPGMPGGPAPYPAAHATALHTTALHATAAHLTAALTASWWLRRGEAAVWALLRRAAALVPAPAAWWRTGPARASGPPSVRPVRRERATRIEGHLLLRHLVTRRGPPSLRWS